MDFTLVGLWHQMGPVAKAVVVILLAMSMYAIGIALERFLTFRRGRERSLPLHRRAAAAGREPAIGCARRPSWRRRSRTRPPPG